MSVLAPPFHQMGKPRQYPHPSPHREINHSPESTSMAPKKKGGMVEKKEIYEGELPQDKLLRK